MYSFRDGDKLHSFFDVLLTVHLSVFISVINQLDAQSFEHMCSKHVET